VTTSSGRSFPAMRAPIASVSSGDEDCTSMS
jgi:hypothetical protein